MGREIIDTLALDQRRLHVLMGHDTNVTALAAALRVDLAAPGYAVNDVAPGGAILIERGHDERGERYVKLSYRTQSPDVLRGGGVAVDRVALPVPGCAEAENDWCPLDRFRTLLEGRIAPLRPAPVR